MPKVYLVYDSTCPNKDKARTNLAQAFSRTGISPSWEEWERSDPESPDHVRRYGSPAILVNGEDVAGESPGDGAASCRIYTDNNGRRDVVPSVDVIVSALLKEEPKTPGAAGGGRSKGPMGGVLTALPAVSAALLPKLTCPACWPAYAWLLGILGIGFVNYTPYLAPLMVFFLTLAVGPLVFHAQNGRGYGPFALGLTASVLTLAGKFIFHSDLVMYGGISMLVIASLWKAWPVKKAGSDEQTCPACVSKRAGLVTDGDEKP